MPTVYCTCTYCDHRFEEYAYDQSDIKAIRCPRCKDRKIKVRQESDVKGDPFGYNSTAPKPDAYIKK